MKPDRKSAAWSRSSASSVAANRGRSSGRNATSASKPARRPNACGIAEVGRQERNLPRAQLPRQHHEVRQCGEIGPLHRHPHARRHTCPRRRTDAVTDDVERIDAADRGVHLRIGAVERHGDRTRTVAPPGRRASSRTGRRSRARAAARLRAAWVAISTHSRCSSGSPPEIKTVPVPSWARSGSSRAIDSVETSRSPFRQ